MASIVVAGAGVAGLSAAVELRRQGWQGRLTVVGAERHPPYRRPPLSKEYLRAAAPPTLRLPQAESLDADWVLGHPAVGIDQANRRLLVRDREPLNFDGLVIATGVAARATPPHLRRIEGVHTLRGIDDAERIRAELGGATAALVIGAGFLGNEVAATFRSLGLPVTLVERQRAPLLSALGETLAARIALLHQEHGVDLRVGREVRVLRGGRRVKEAVLDDGTTVRADLVVVALGGTPATSWLHGTGLQLAHGVQTDEAGFVAPGIVAAGDIAYTPHPLLGGARVRLEHYSNAGERGARVARSLIGLTDRSEPPPVPSFWTHLYGWRIQSVGFTGAAYDYRTVEDGAPDRFVGEYRRRGRLVGAITNGRPHAVARYREELTFLLAH